MNRPQARSEKFITALTVFFLLGSLLTVKAQESKNSFPPSNVVVSPVGKGMISPESEFVGTVFYREVSEVSAEVSGLVEEVNFEEGRRVRKGEELVSLGSDLLIKTLQATQATYEQVLTDLEKAGRDLKRAEDLFKNELVSEQSYDEKRYAVSGLEKKVNSLKADVERLKVELGKKTVRSPFDGVVIRKHTDRGEWLSAGSAVATVADDSFPEIIVNVPEQITRFIRQDMTVSVTAGSNSLSGKVIAVIPRGDIASRTFPVKIRLSSISSLIEGMEARVALPSGPAEQTYTVNRDAVITVFGNTAVFAVVDLSAKMFPVQVVGYKGMTAGIHAEGLEEGMQVVVKGNERLMDGQAVKIISSQ